jgi:hypothetical protein
VERCGFHSRRARDAAGFRDQRERRVARHRPAAKL